MASHIFKINEGFKIIECVASLRRAWKIIISFYSEVQNDDMFGLHQLLYVPFVAKWSTIFTSYLLTLSPGRQRTNRFIEAFCYKLLPAAAGIKMFERDK